MLKMLECERKLKMGKKCKEINNSEKAADAIYHISE